MFEEWLNHLLQRTKIPYLFFIVLQPHFPYCHCSSAHCGSFFVQQKNGSGEPFSFSVCHVKSKFWSCMYTGDFSDFMHLFIACDDLHIMKVCSAGYHKIR